MNRTWRVSALLALLVILGGAVSAQEPAQGAQEGAQEPAQGAQEGAQGAQEPAQPPPAAAASERPDSLANAATQAGGQALDAARSSGEALGEGARSLWQEILVPMGQRLAGALPSLLKAVLLLLLFWIVALALGAAVRRGLSLTRIDERAAEEWGLGGLLVDRQGERRSLSVLAGRAVKWIVLLFGFVAFFQSLDLAMVAGPLQGVVDTVVGVLPSLLEALVILVIYWALATIVRFAVTRGLAVLKFDERAARFLPPREEEGKQVGASEAVGRLSFYVILVFGLAPFLEALGQTALVEPLGEMLATALGFIPNLVAALILFVVGRVVATIVRELVGNLLAASGADAAADRAGLGRLVEERKLSEIVGAIAYFLVFVPAIVAAVDSLQIEAISAPIQSTLTQTLAAVPLLFAAFVVVAIGVWVARLVRELLETFLAKIGFDGLPQKLGLRFLEPKQGQASPSTVAGVVVMLIIVLFTAQQAFATLRLEELAGLIGSLIAYLPRLFAALVILLAALAVSSHASSLVRSALANSPYQDLLATTSRYAIVFLGLSMALSQLGVAEEVILITVASVLGATGLALGLAFGLGGRERAKQIIESRAEES